MGKRKYRDIEIRGVVYEHARAAADALGVKPATVLTAIKKGTLHRVGTGRVGPEPMRVLIKGREFESVVAAAKHYKCDPYTVWAAISDGDPDRIARPQRYNPWKSKPVTIGALRFPSYREASRALGFSNPEYVRVAFKRKSATGMRRIMAAAMRLEAVQAAAERKEREAVA